MAKEVAKGPEFVLRPEMGPRVVAALQAALAALGRSDERLVREFEDACPR